MMQPVATDIGNEPIRYADSVPLALLFDIFRKFAEAKFSAGTSLKHIEDAETPRSQVAHWEAGETIRNSDWVIRRRAYERPRLVEGLAIYLFDRFVGNSDGTLPNVFLRTPSGDNKLLAQMALQPSNEHDFKQINFRNFPGVVRTRLLEMASEKEKRYPFVNTGLWEVRIKDYELSPTPGDECEASSAIPAILGPFLGMPLYFHGRRPNVKEIEALLGQVSRSSEDHISELVAELHFLFRTSPDGKLYQAVAAAHIGVGQNTRTFRDRIWAKFISELTHEDRAKLPSKGNPGHSRRRPMR